MFFARATSVALVDLAACLRHVGLSTFRPLEFTKTAVEADNGYSLWGCFIRGIVQTRGPFREAAMSAAVDARGRMEFILSLLAIRAPPLPDKATKAIGSSWPFNSAGTSSLRIAFTRTLPGGIVLGRAWLIYLGVSHWDI